MTALTIEIDNPKEVEQVLRVFKTMNLASVHVVVDEPVNKKADKTVDALKLIHRPIIKRLDIEALKKAKNYQGVNRARFNQLIKEINIIEPVEVLLSQLSR